MRLWAVGPAGQGVESTAPLSLRPSGGLPLWRPKPEPARGRCPAGTRVPPWPRGCCSPALHPHGGRGRGGASAHARVAGGGRGRRMRALPQQAGTPRGARPSPRAHARSLARSRRPAASPPALRVGATPARARVVSGRPEWPGSLGSRPPPPPPRLPANPSLPFLTEWGRRCSGSRVLDPARARSRAVSRCLARAALRFPSVSGAGGSVKRRPRFLFPFLPLPSVGSSILHPSTPPTLPPRPAAAGGGGGGDGGRRRPPRSRLG